MPETTPPSLKPFFLLWSGQALSLLGSQITQFALIWWLTLETGSASVLATATFLGFVPMIAIGPLAGALIDRWNRQRILLVSDSLIASIAAILAMFFWHGTVTTLHVFIALFLRAVASGFHQPAMMASTSLMVGKEHMIRIQGLNETLQGMLRIASAPLAGVLLGLIPVAAILALDVATAAFAILPLFLIRIPQPRVRPKEKQSVLSDIAEGFRFVRAWPGLLILVLISTTNNFFLVPAFALLPLLVQDYFGKGPLELGWMSSSFGIGLLIGGTILGFWGGFRRRLVTTFCGLLGLGLAVSVIGLAPATRFDLAIGANFVVGFMIAMANGPIRAVLQIAVPADFQGRVFTLLQTMSGAATPVGLLIAAPLAEIFGVRSWFLTAAVACVAMAVLGFTVPAVLRIEDHVAVASDGVDQETATVAEDTTDL